jgi:hypothetical protein
MKNVSRTGVWLFTLAFLLLSVPAAFAALHPGGDVDMRDVNGELVTVSGKPYSPKMTCGSATSTCHNMINPGGHNYESDPGTATKSHFRRSGEEVTYGVPYPEHGVTAGYHFQQGRNLYWNQTSRDYYKLPNFTSSPGMYGKY